MIDHLTCSHLLQPGGDPLVLCFADFSTPGQAAIALDALQGEKIILVCAYRFCKKCLHMQLDAIFSAFLVLLLSHQKGIELTPNGFPFHLVWFQF